MKNIISIFILSLSFTTFKLDKVINNAENTKIVQIEVVKTAYSKGFEDGYCSGWKIVLGSTSSPCTTVPIPPTPNFEENTYEKGFEKGFELGYSERNAKLDQMNKNAIKTNTETTNANIELKTINDETSKSKKLSLDDFGGGFAKPSSPGGGNTGFDIPDDFGTSKFDKEAGITDLDNLDGFRKDKQNEKTKELISTFGTIGIIVIVFFVIVFFSREAKKNKISNCFYFPVF